MPTETVAPDADSAAGGWTTNSGGTTSLFATIDETTASDTDYVRSPTRSAVAADLIVRLKQGSTVIATWTHNAIGTTYVDAVQTLTAPQLAAITDFADLFIELDDNAGAVYRASIGNPTGALTTPVTVSYRYKAEDVSAVAYTGPGNIVSGATFWGGLRAYNTAYATGSNPALDLHNTSTGTFVATINILSTGALDVATAAGIISGGAAKIGKLYDQSGNGNHATQATAADMPTLVLSGHGALPVMQFDRTAPQRLLTPAMTIGGQPWSHSAVAKRTGDFTSYSAILSSDLGLYFHNSANNVMVYGGVLTGTVAATDSVMHGIQAVVNDTASIGNVDGSGSTISAGNTSGSAVVWGVGANNSAGNGLTGDICEAGIWASLAFSGANNTALFANQDAYWGI